MCCHCLRRRVLIADSWFGSVACTLELFRRDIFAVMNVKTGSKGFPKDTLLSLVGEIKGDSEAQRAKRRERRGLHAAFQKEFQVGGRKVTVTAAGHNKKLPLLLVSTASSLLPGDDHKKTWTTINASGEQVTHELVTKQPKMFDLYRKNMNLVDLHNKLRQGQGSMAEAWHTVSWVNRHFAELLGFIEVNIYKSLVYFIKDKWAKMSHNEFRKRLAWAFLTLGKEEYLDDVLSSSRTSTSVDAWQSSGVNSASQLYMGPHEHRFETFNREKLEHHTCGYCGCRTTKFCVTCKEDGHGVIAVCGRRSGRNCIDRHQMGEEVKHGSWRIQKVTVEARMATDEDADVPVVPSVVPSDSVTPPRRSRRQRREA